jgi:predicted SAM-dependent methyltransferase
MGADSTERFRLHLGGVERKEGWKVLNAQPGPAVDFVGTCDNLSQFGDATVDEIYASHIFEHLGYFDELPRTLYEVSRVLKVGGVLMVAVPDLEVLSKFVLMPGLPLQLRFHVMRAIYGGQSDAWDFHKCGYTFDLLTSMLRDYRFGNIERVKSFGLFKDCSELKLANVSISLNVRAVRQGGDPPKRAAWLPPEYESKAP